MLDRLLGRGHVGPGLDMDVYRREAETVTANVDVIREMLARRDRCQRQEDTGVCRRCDDRKAVEP